MNWEMGLVPPPPSGSSLYDTEEALKGTALYANVKFCLSHSKPYQIFDFLP